MWQNSREATTTRYPQNKTEFSIKTSKSVMLDQAKVSTTTTIATAVQKDGLTMSVDTNHSSTLNNMGRPQVTGIVSGMCTSLFNTVWLFFRQNIHEL